MTTKEKAKKPVKEIESELLNTVEAAKMLNISHRTLQRWRRTQSAEERPPVTRVGGVVRYSKSALLKWIERRTTDS
jgi:excisionase family DNA binding protein